MIEDYVKSNLSNLSIENLKNTINEAVSSNEEQTLPGLGVLFKLYYSSLNEQEKNDIINKIDILI